MQTEPISKITNEKKDKALICMKSTNTLRSLLNELARLTVMNTVKQASLFNRDLRVKKTILLIEKST